MTTKKTSRDLVNSLFDMYGAWLSDPSCSYYDLLNRGTCRIDDYVAEATRGEPDEVWPDAVYLGTRAVYTHVVGLLHRFDRGADIMKIAPAGRGRFSGSPAIGARGTLRRWGRTYEFEEGPT